MDIGQWTVDSGHLQAPTRCSLFPGCYPTDQLIDKGTSFHLINCAVLWIHHGSEIILTVFIDRDLKLDHLATILTLILLLISDQGAVYYMAYAQLVTWRGFCHALLPFITVAPCALTYINSELYGHIFTIPNMPPRRRGQGRARVVVASTAAEPLPTAGPIPIITTIATPAIAITPAVPTITPAIPAIVPVIPAIIPVIPAIVPATPAITPIPTAVLASAHATTLHIAHRPPARPRANN